MVKCSKTTFHGVVFPFLATPKLKMHRSDSPQIILTTIADVSSSNKTGTRNVNAMANLQIKVDSVDSHISLVVCLFSDSSEI
jgi:hypothetical protein